MSTLLSDSMSALAAPTRLRPALVITWCGAEPARVGEVLLPPGPGSRGATLGRGLAEPGELPRLVPLRQRPGESVASAPLALRRLSRQQLWLRATTRGVELRNEGRCPLLRAGAPVMECALAPGESVQLRKALVLTCVLRPQRLPSASSVPRGVWPTFGAADEAGLVGESPAAWALREALGFAAARPRGHVLLLGPSGSGKELAARTVHLRSRRAGRAWVSRNAATLPAGLIDAELFGNRAAYPNPGTPARPGLVGAADGGVLFLDEIAELSEALQARLLRVLDAGGEYQRLGEARTRTSDVRLVGATNRAPEALKHDLLARFGLRVVLPGLEERIEDIPLLARALLRRFAQDDPPLRGRFFSESADGFEPRIQPRLMEALLGHRYRTHARELAALLWRALATSPGEELVLTDALEAELRAVPAAVGSPAPVTAEQLRAALARHDGVQARVWPELGLKNRFALRRLMKKLGVEAPEGGKE